MVAREVIVRCGSLETTWKRLKRAAKRLLQIKDMVSPSHGHDKEWQQDTLLRPRLDSIDLLKQRWIFGVSLMGYHSDRSSVYEMHAGGPLELLCISRLLEATDQRDKVYAFLGIGRVKAVSMDGMPIDMDQTIEDEDRFKTMQDPGIPDAISPGIIVDYVMPVSHVYQQFAKYMINKYRTLDILCILNTYPSQSYDMPSWTPDWRDSQGLKPRMTDNFDYLSQFFAASGETLAEMQDPTAWGNLQVTGCYIDQVNELLYYSTTVSGVTRLHHDLARKTHTEEQYASAIGEALEQAHRESPSTVFTWSENSNITRRCCRTKTGRVCLVPEWTCTGDQLWILLGGRLPFILRPGRDERREFHEQSKRVAVFELVGPCCGPDLMDGKFYEHYHGSGGNTPEDVEMERPILQGLTLI